MNQKIVIGVITFQRPVMLGKLLDSLSKQHIASDSASVALALVDNDPNRSAEPVFNNLSPTLPFPAFYLVEKQRGIPHARNKVLDFALAEQADYVAFIDDDEYATPTWLAELYEVLVENRADAVQGPVKFVAEPGCPKWMTEGLAHRNAKMLRQAEASPKKRLSTRNLIMSMRLVTGLGLRFDTAFALSGGSDVDFFYRAHLKGARNLWTNRAKVMETIPRARLELRQQLLRSFRSAAGTSYSLLRAQGALKALLKTTPKILETFIYGTALLLSRGLFSRHWCVAAMRKLASCVGFLAGLLGLKGEEYRRIQGY